jgi:photosystem II stability/assembly factor-like uncharacterized protein
MSDEKDLETRLRGYLARGAGQPAPEGLKSRVLATASRQRSHWVPQVLAAVAVVVLAIGVGFAFQSLRAHRAVGPIGGGVVSPSATTEPSASSTPTPAVTPSASASGSGALGLSSIRMTSATAGWATGDRDNGVYGPTSAVYRTEDSGNHWRQSSPAGAIVLNAFFLNATSAWFVDASRQLYRTQDGGKTWRALPHVLVNPYDLDFIDSSHGWSIVGLGAAAGSEGVEIYRTSDGGTTWQLVSVTIGPNGQSSPGSLPFGCNKAALGFLNASVGWAPGECAGGKPFFYVTRDGGKTWRQVNLPLPAAIASGCNCNTSAPMFTSTRDGSFLLTGQAAVVYVTHDSGGSWSARSVPAASAGGLDFVNGNTGWVVDYAGGTVYFTSDGGSRWTAISTIPAATNVPQLDFVDQATGYALRGPGKPPLLKTTDGGHTWQEIQPSL